MKPYSIDLRERVLQDCDVGLGTRAVAQKYSVSESWVRRLKQRRREDGSIEPRTATPGPAPGPDRPPRPAPDAGPRDPRADGR